MFISCSWFSVFVPPLSSCVSTLPYAGSLALPVEPCTHWTHPGFSAMGNFLFETLFCHRPAPDGKPPSPPVFHSYYWCAISDARRHGQLRRRRKRKIGPNVESRTCITTETRGGKDPGSGSGRWDDVLHRYKVSPPEFVIITSISAYHKNLLFSCFFSWRQF